MGLGVRRSALDSLPGQHRPTRPTRPTRPERASDASETKAPDYRALKTSHAFGETTALRRATAELSMNLRNGGDLPEVFGLPPFARAAELEFSVTG